MRNFMDLSRALKSLADAFHTIKLKLDGLYDSAGALGNQFELIEEITLTEDVAVIERATEPDGTAYNFSNVMLYIDIPDTATNTGQGIFNINAYTYGVGSMVAANTAKIVKFCYFIKNGVGFDFTYMGTTQSNPIIHSRVDFIDKITSLKINMNPITSPMPANTTIKIYAVRA